MFPCYQVDVYECTNPATISATTFWLKIAFPFPLLVVLLFLLILKLLLLLLLLLWIFWYGILQACSKNQWYKYMFIKVPNDICPSRVLLALHMSCQQVFSNIHRITPVNPAFFLGANHQCYTPKELQELTKNTAKIIKNISTFQSELLQPKKKSLGSFRQISSM